MVDYVSHARADVEKKPPCCPCRPDLLFLEEPTQDADIELYLKKSARDDPRSSPRDVRRLRRDKTDLPDFGSISMQTLWRYVDEGYDMKI